MASVNYCRSCGYRNNGSLSYCGICSGKLSSQVRGNPINSESFRAKKIVIFDLDMTILDNSQRYKDAKRANLVDEDGKPVRKGLQTPGSAYVKAQNFLYKKENLQKDVAIRGAKDVINHFAGTGHIIAYCTARNYKHFEVTRDQLIDKDFDIYQDDSGKDLLFLNNKPGTKKAKYKRGVFESIKASYDIVAVFDDSTEVLEEAAQMSIPGVYESIKDYLKFIPKSNPHYTDIHGQVRWRPEIEQYSSTGEDPDADPYDTADAHLDPTGMGRVPLQNPPVKPRRKKMKSGKYRKEPAKKYADRFMESSKMIEEFPDRGQRYAVCISYIERYYGKSGLKSVGAKANPVKKKDSLKANLANPKKIIIKLKNKTQSDKVFKLGRELASKGIYFDTDITGGKYPKVRTWFLDFSLKGGTIKQVIAHLKKAKVPHTVEQIKTNPANPKKIDKGKKLYKHMNKKEPAKVEKTTIDIGDVWYQVGEGGCWSIGYMSGKETGSKKQKYIHNFNEESKDGNVPQLYATMPDSGKPLLIIKGGTWKIKTDDSGTAWIYD